MSNQKRRYVLFINGMGSPLGPSLANLILVYFEKNSYKIHLIINLTITGDMIAAFLFYLPHQNI